MSKSGHAKRSHRLRKKLHLDEFQQLGFGVRFVFVQPKDTSGQSRFWDAFIADAIEARRLTYGGGTEGFVVPEGRGSATDIDVRGIRDWLEAHPEVAEVSVGPLVDAWYVGIDGLPIEPPARSG